MAEKFRERARRGHGRWFVNRDELERKKPIRCLCGETFTGFIGWSRHAFLEPAVPSETE